MQTSKAMANQVLLEVLTAPSVQKVYSDNGIGADTDISVFEAQKYSIPEGAYMIGQVAVPAHVNTVPTSSVVLVKPLVQRDEFGHVIKPPVYYEQVWSDQHLEGSQGGSFWRVEGPPGYVALGDVACTGNIRPCLEFAKYACIRQDLLSEGVLDCKALWTDKGSGSKVGASIWKVDGDGLGGLFIAQQGYEKPSRQVFVLPAKVSKKVQ